MKAKTHSGAKKRVKVRAKGKMVIQKSCKNHLLSNKSKRQKELFKSGLPIDGTNRKKLKKLLPNI